MSLEPLLGQIVLMPYNFAPRGWAFCQGQLLSISQNTALFSILGTTYGGDGRTNFALPDLRSRLPLGQGTGPGLSTYVLGEQAGTEAETILVSEMAAHTHSAVGSNNPANNPSPGNESWAADGAGIVSQYAATKNATMDPRALTPAGGTQPHNNIMPVLAVNYCIALQGIFPSRN